MFWTFPANISLSFIDSDEHRALAAVDKSISS